MRHTLLPREEKMVLRREYRVRALIVLCFGLSVAGVIGIGSLFPSFVKSSDSKKEATMQLEELKKMNDQSGMTDIQSKMASYIPMLLALKDMDNVTISSAYIDKIVSVRGAVTINSIDIGSTASNTVNMTIAGVAPTRDSLLAFRSSLEDSFPDSTIDLPLSDLAKSSKISYRVKLIMSIR